MPFKLLAWLAALTAGATAPAAAQSDLPQTLRGHGGPIQAVAVSATGDRALTGSFDYSLILWDISAADAVILHRMTGHDGAVNDVAFLPGGTRAASVADDGALLLWDLTSGTLAEARRAEPVKAPDIAVSPDGTRAAVARWDGIAHLHDLTTENAPPVILEGHRGNVNAAAFSADGSVLWTAAHDGAILEWEAATGALRRPIHRHGWGINALALAGPGRLAFGALDGTVALVDVASGALTQIAKSERPILALKASQDGVLLAYGDGAGTIGVVTAEGLDPVETGPVTFGPVWDLDFVPGTTSLYHAGLDDFAGLWRIAPRDFGPIRAELPRRFQLRDAAGPGELEFLRKCSVCHTLTPDDGNRAGPTLHALFGRRAGTLPGYPYSPALRNLEVTWTEATVAQLFDDGPDVMVPGTKMPIQRLKSVKRRDDLIAFLKSATAPIE